MCQWPRTTQNTMVRKKKLSPTGAKNQHGEYRNVHLSLNEDELSFAGLDIGDEVVVHVQEDRIIVQSTHQETAEHEL